MLPDEKDKSENISDEPRMIGEIISDEEWLITVHAHCSCSDLAVAEKQKQ